MSVLSCAKGCKPRATIGDAMTCACTPTQYDSCYYVADACTEGDPYERALSPESALVAVAVTQLATPRRKMLIGTQAG